MGNTQTLTVATAAEVANVIGLENVNTDQQLMLSLMSLGWKFIDTQSTKPYAKRIAQMRGIALPTTAICKVRDGFVLHTAESPLADDTKRGMDGFWTTDTEFTAQKFWDALDEQRRENYGRDWSIGESGVVWGEEVDDPTKPRRIKQHEILERLERIEDKLDQLLNG